MTQSIRHIRVVRELKERGENKTVISCDHREKQSVHTTSRYTLMTKHDRTCQMLEYSPGRGQLT
jgi:hypothetical protein